tara:strand:+ start:261 stop:692 length:432 start_codon:yes stop_codon:yes gene_type:complete
MAENEKDETNPKEEFEENLTKTIDKMFCKKILPALETPQSSFSIFPSTENTGIAKMFEDKIQEALKNQLYSINNKNSDLHKLMAEKAREIIKNKPQEKVEEPPVEEEEQEEQEEQEDSSGVSSLLSSIFLPSSLKIKNVKRTY